MAITTHKLICIHCEKTEEYIEQYTDEYPHSQHKPENWYILQPNFEHSQWLITDFGIGGDFCSLECILAYTQEAIEEKDNPRPFIVAGDLCTGKGDLSTGEMWGGEIER